MPRRATTRAEPVRTCVGCRRSAAASTLVRFVADGAALVAGAGRPGRGAWLCEATVVDCFDRATNQRAWPRALRTKIDQPSIVELRAQLSGAARHS